MSRSDGESWIVPSLSTMALDPPDPGYQTPTEECHPPFLRTEPPSPAASPALPPPASAPRPSPEKRPPLRQLPSYYLRRREDSRRNVNPSLDDMLHKGVRQPKEGDVGFRERVACYQWTFFTMVGSPCSLCSAQGLSSAQSGGYG